MLCLWYKNIFEPNHFYLKMLAQAPKSHLLFLEEGLNAIASIPKLYLDNQKYRVYALVDPSTTVQYPLPKAIEMIDYQAMVELTLQFPNFLSCRI